jgi:prepilin-type N-terminal cleavage/methylation domain-containing protein
MKLRSPAYNGFTLIELMVTLALASALAIGLSTSLSISFKTGAYTDKFGHMNQNAAYAMTTVRKYIRLSGYPNPYVSANKQRRQNNNIVVYCDTAESTEETSFPPSCSTNSSLSGESDVLTIEYSPPVFEGEEFQTCDGSTITSDRYMDTVRESFYIAELTLGNTTATYLFCDSQINNKAGRQPRPLVRADILQFQYGTADSPDESNVTWRGSDFLSRYSSQETFNRRVRVIYFGFVAPIANEQLNRDSLSSVAQQGIKLFDTTVTHYPRAHRVYQSAAFIQNGLRSRVIQ